MNKNNYTKLELQMQKDFDADNVSQDLWNAPNDGMFLAALEEIESNKKEEHQPNALYLSGILIFSLLLLLIGHSVMKMEGDSIQVVENSDEVNTSLAGEKTSEVIQVLKPISTAVPSASSALQLNTARENEVSISGPALARKEGVVSQGVGVSNLIVTRNDRGAAKYTQVTASPQKNIAKNINNANSTIQYRQPSTSSSQLAFVEDEKGGDVTGSRTVTSIKDVQVERGDIDVRGIDAMGILALSDQLVLPTMPNPTKLSEVQSRFSIIAHTGVNFNSFLMPDADEEKLKDYTNWNAGRFIDLGVQQNITKRFSIRYDLGYTIVSNSSRVLDNMIYDTDNETIDVAGNDVYNCDVVVNSPTTRFICNMNLVLNHDMSDNESMRTVTEIIQDYEIARLGIRPQYDMYSKNRMKISAGVGLSANYVTKFEQNMDFKMFHDGYVMTRESFVDNDANKLNRFFVSASLHASVLYQLTNRVSVGLHANYGKGLTSLNKNAGTFLRDFRIGFTGNYSF